MTNVVDRFNYHLKMYLPKEPYIFRRLANDPLKFKTEFYTKDLVGFENLYYCFESQSKFEELISPKIEYLVESLTKQVKISRIKFDVRIDSTSDSLIVICKGCV